MPHTVLGNCWTDSCTSLRDFLWKRMICQNCSVELRYKLLISRPSERSPVFQGSAFWCCASLILRNQWFINTSFETSNICSKISVFIFYWRFLPQRVLFLGKALVVLKMRGMLLQNQKGKVVLHRCVQSLRYKLVNESVKLANKKDLVSKTLHFVATFTRPMLVI